MSITSSFLTNNTFSSTPLYRIPTKTPLQKQFFCYSQLSSVTRKDEIVVVGGGIAGLATALALHRKGIRSLVLEQTESLRTGGTSLTLFKNGWKVLDMLGVGNGLRTQFLEIEGMAIRTDEGKELRSFKFKDADQSQEVRAVERSVLLQALADQLPENSLQFSSKLAKIENDDATGETIMELVNGNRLCAKIVVGCDGIRSPIARWMGFSEPKYSGHCAFRGLAYYPNGQPYQSMVNYIYGKGLRAGFVPVSPTKVYWFICYNSSSPGIVELNLDRPGAKNAIGKSMLSGLLHSLETVNGDLSTRVMMISSSVPKVFCAGADLKERRSMSPMEVQSFVNTLRSTFSLLEALHIPTIAVIEGAALGGGLEMALSCDLRICGEDAVMGLPETGLAIIPGAGGTQRLSRLVGISLAKELIFTGRKVSGTEALTMGLANYCVSSGSAYSKALDLARQINEKGPVAMRMAKRAINEGIEMDMASALRLEEECYEQILNTKDRLEGIAAFAEKRKPRYTGE